MGRHEWFTGVRRWRLAALLGVGTAALALVVTLLHTLPGDGGSTAGTSRDGDKVHGTPATGSRPPEPYVGWGFTHTQYSADAGSGPAVGRVERLLARGGGLPQDQAIMGWGADNPEPVQGYYDFGALDRRIDFIRRSGGTPVITLCCSPDWMKGGRPGVGNTDWSQAALETAPTPDHYQDFADLAATVAKRYPDVRHFIVWNEFKGFWNDARGRWDHEGYTAMYNLVYQALKKVDRDIMVGGPYLAMDSLDPRDEKASGTVKGPWGAMDQRVLDAFAYWNRHKAGADFVVVDGSSYTNDDELLPDEFAATDKFTAVGAWVRRQTRDLPLWWAEYYVEPADGDDERDGWSEAHRRAVHAAGLIAMVRGGAGSGFYWNPQERTGRCPGCLWSPTDTGGGGRALPMYGLLSRFARAFPPGSRYETVSVAPDDVPHVRVLATSRTVLVVNTLDRPISARVDGERFAMGAYEVRWLDR
ncbi:MULTISPECIES: GH39 family glycosyl hydrolase [Streptomyces]|uniref:Xylan 1,4-beta-xylosidase n=1 Tax=Streptomyces tricolor TaxID=68277 RepID=A0ABS9JUL6_9ACTN|nr:MULTISPECIES: xylan 1,4-beta-xylosidase [Streptomyces]MCG0069271.1 xylan 1,4-beta-xylosidase [Streptomyces tricolor]OYP18470.1 xylan 1,4-beta-xylosidase [Streptomyces sp. FBKL.4005]BCM65874.1 putative xylan 1,4-beta-xylosidase [Streptomyces sp. EAS-AB2608]